MGKKRVIEKGTVSERSSAESSSAISPKRKKKSAKKIESGKIYIKCSYNNTMITVTDDNGGVIAWATAGSLGFSGPKKATPFAATKVTSAIVEKVAKTGPHSVALFVSGIGPGRDSAIRSLASSGFDIKSISDATPIPHNGPRAKKPRRT